MELGLNNRTALVTGASMGIGRAIAIGLAREGVTLALAARRVNLLEEVADEIKGISGKKPAIIEADLYNPETPERLAAVARERLGRVDILINAAGGSRPMPYDSPVEKWTEGLMVNFFRLREVSHAVLPGMIDNRWGRIVNITGSSEPRGVNAANSAKAAVHAWAKGLTREITKFGVTINSIQPGRIMSEQIVRMYPTAADQQKFAQENIPAGRFGTPEELAALAVFLASEPARYITGTVIPVDGGMSRFAF